jgi:hypothetical protein
LAVWATPCSVGKKHKKSLLSKSPRLATPGAFY